MTRLLPSALLLFVGAATALAQDPATVDPRHYSRLLENSQVRVIRARYPPGGRSVMHSHPENIAISLAEARLRSTYPDGEYEHRTLRRGRVTWSSGVTHEPQNVGDTVADVIVIEFKLKTDGQPKTTTDAGVEVASGVTLARVLEGDRVRAFRLTADPGSSRQAEPLPDADVLIVPVIGSLEVRVPGQGLATLSPGEVRLVPRETPYDEANRGDGPAQWTIVLIR